MTLEDTRERLEGHGYRVLGELGRGGMGVVWLARQVALNRDVAVKCLLPEASDDAVFWKRFVGEAQAYRALAHPNIVKVFDVSIERDLPFIVFEYIPGGVTLDELLTRGELSQAVRHRVLRGTLAALEAVHALRMVHRDLKPANVLIAPEGDPKLIDFGLARHLGAEETRNTKDGQVLGTLAYMPPEQLEGREVTPAADLYAWGLMAYEVVAGCLVFSPRATTGRVETSLRLRGQIPPVARRDPSLDPRLARAIMSCLDPEPAKRPTSISEILKLFRAPSRPADATAPIPPPVPTARTTGKTQLPATLPPADSRSAALRWLALTALVGTLGFFAGAGLSIRAPRTPDSPALSTAPSPIATSHADPDPADIRALSAALDRLDTDSVFRQAERLALTFAKGKSVNAEVASLLPADIGTAIAKASPWCAQALEKLGDGSDRYALLQRIYVLEELDEFLQERGLPTVAGARRLLPAGYAEQVYRGVENNPENPRSRLGRETTFGPLHDSYLDGRPPPWQGWMVCPEWEYFHWSLSLTSAPTEGAAKISSLTFTVPDGSLRADARRLMLLADASADGTCVLWIDFNGRLKVPLVRQGPGMANGRHDNPTHVRVVPSALIGTGKNVIRIWAAPHPGHRQMDGQYVGFLTLVRFGERAP